MGLTETTIAETPLIYVAGPYMGDAPSHDYRSFFEIDKNINIARQACVWLITNGLWFFSPHLNSAHFETITPEVPPSVWYNLDVRILRHCDAMLVVGDWKNSKGTLGEIDFCRQNGIHVYYFDNEADRNFLEHWMDTQSAEKESE